MTIEIRRIDNAEPRMFGRTAVRFVPGSGEIESVSGVVEAEQLSDPDSAASQTPRVRSAGSANLRATLAIA